MSEIKLKSNSIYVIKGEISLIIASLRKNNPRWSSYSIQGQHQDQLSVKAEYLLYKKLQQLKESLDKPNIEEKLTEDANYFLVPFLDVVRSEETSGPVTALCLNSIEKFITYSIINTQNGSTGAVEAITDAVIHAHFVSTDSSSDEIVLLKILQVLHRLFLSPVGILLSNESVCELMQSCFRMCFIERANELLKKSAESALTDMIRLLFSRLYLFGVSNSSMSVPSKKEIDPHQSNNQEQSQSPTHNESSKNKENIPVIQVEEATPPSNKPGPVKPDCIEFKTKRGVKFSTNTGSTTPSSEVANNEDSTFHQKKMATPYGIPCVRELFRFLISLINPYEKQNTDSMITLGLKLLLVALESGIEHVHLHSSLLNQVKNELLKNLISLLSNNQSSSINKDLLLTSGNSPILILILRIFLVVFDQLRYCLKFQLEIYIKTLLNELSIDMNSKEKPWSYEQREIGLEYLLQLWKIPKFSTELFLNYDCDLYCSNLFEEVIKLLSKISLIPNEKSVNALQILSLDGVITLLDQIEGHCNDRINNSNTSDEIGDSSANSSVFLNDEEEEQINEMKEDSLVIEPNPKKKSQSFDILGDIETKKSKALTNSVKSMRSTIEEQQLPTHEQLMATRHKKKILHTGSEYFNNTSPSKGIEYLQNSGIFSTPLNNIELSQFLRENPLLDKKAIGDFIAAKKNSAILEAFVKGFDLHKTRIDEALRMFLEAFRLPGESPLIENIIDKFSQHYWNMNKKSEGYFITSDAAFTFCYAIIMLNTDQHNTNVRKQGNPMTLEEFKRNVKGVNGGEDFNQDMLRDIYHSIKSNEIVMPSEQTGLLKENYVWKLLLRRSVTQTGQFISPYQDEGVFDHDLFSLSWAPVLSSISYTFDKVHINSDIITKSLVGFKKCATISTHYGMSDVFDNLIISMCKFTKLLTSLAEKTSNSLGVAGETILNTKSQASIKCLFGLVHRHGDILRGEGWKSFIDILIVLFKLELLPKFLTESEDFTDPSGRISLIRRSEFSSSNMPRAETGIFSSLYSYIALTGDSTGSKSSMEVEEENRRLSQSLINECRPELLLSESKFLHLDSLLELIKSLIASCPIPTENSKKATDYDEDASVFVLEVLLKISIHNRDRAMFFWEVVKDHLFNVIMSSSKYDFHYLLERSTVGLMRVALRLMRKEDICQIVLQSLRILLCLRPYSVYELSQQLSFGLHEILKTTAANIHAADDWGLIFSLIEYFGIGKSPPSSQNSESQFLLQKSEDESTTSNSNGQRENVQENERQKLYSTLQHSVSHDTIPNANSKNSNQRIDYSSNSDRGYTSDSELEIRSSSDFTEKSMSPSHSWIFIDDTHQPTPTSSQQPITLVNRPSIPFLPPSKNFSAPNLPTYTPDPKSLVKSCETLSFLVRDAAHITPENFTICISTIKSFVEASTHRVNRKMSGKDILVQQQQKKKKTKRAGAMPQRSKSLSATNNKGYEADESDSEDSLNSTQSVSIQLLDLLHTLHTRAASIFQWWEKELNTQNQLNKSNQTLWNLGWSPLLQAISILCTDSRKQVRTTALTYLQRALLVHDLNQLNPIEWYSCFNEVLFPLMSMLLDNLNPEDLAGMEETRMRSSTLLCKVFLQHLNQLFKLNENFEALWMNILDFMAAYMKNDNGPPGELIIEAVPENLKNLLLVMETAGVFHTADGYTKLWMMTWDKVDKFLPNLRAELMKTCPPPVKNVETPQNIETSTPVPAPPENSETTEKIVTEKIENITSDTLNQEGIAEKSSNDSFDCIVIMGPDEESPVKEEETSNETEIKRTQSE